MKMSEQDLQKAFIAEQVTRQRRLAVEQAQVNMAFSIAMFRAECSKQFLNTMLGGEGPWDEETIVNEKVQLAVSYADALIRELQSDDSPIRLPRVNMGG
ncbi:MAG: hypothetical protein PHG87_07490 [Candidatus Omnitrophica bacterium]|nr:hypothetical protein [Candidatus Omnitrophota bacterium]